MPPSQLKFRRLLVTNDLTKVLFEEITDHLAEQALHMRAGTIVDATIIVAPSSTKSDSGERDPEMRQAKTGNQWHHGMKGHIGIDAESCIVHSMVSTAANVNDVNLAGALLHGDEPSAYGDAGYRGVDSARKPKARGGTSQCRRASSTNSEHAAPGAGEGREDRGEHPLQGSSNRST
jgi:transposase, IS5 family